MNVVINQSHQQSQKTNSSQMSEEEAISILGIKKGSNSDDIKRAYYDLMKKFHPDKNGNNYLSNLISEAKNKLLNK